MRRLGITCLLLGVVFSGPCLAIDLGVYGGGVTGAEITEVSDILANPAGFEGKTVRVRGKVAAVCEKMGCWLDIAPTEGSEIQIKVKDGEIVFPTSAIGKDAVAEGVVEILKLSKDEFVELRKHQAEEQKTEFDPASVGDGPFEIVRIKGTGAVIQE